MGTLQGGQHGPRRPQFLLYEPAEAEVMEQRLGQETGWCLSIIDPENEDAPFVVQLPAGDEMPSAAMLDHILRGYRLKVHPLSGSWGPELEVRGRRRRHVILISEELEDAFLEDWGTWNRYAAAVAAPAIPPLPNPATAVISATGANLPVVEPTQQLRPGPGTAAMQGHFTSTTRGTAIASASGAAVMLVVSVGLMPIDYYAWLRVVVTAAAIVLAVITVRADAASWLVGLIPIGVLFNPIRPVYLDRDDWRPLDLIAAGVFVAIAIWASKQDPRTE